MLSGLINCIKGNYILKAQGRFPERILNIASTSGIYVSDVKKEDSQTLTLSVSKKGATLLLEKEIEGLTVTVSDKFGIPMFLRRHKKRFILIFLPAILAMSVFIYSEFIWKVEITGGDTSLRARVAEVISKNGVYFGAFKRNVDKYEVKRKAILEIDDLVWLWVDIKGTTAKVRIEKRSPKPPMNEIHEPADVIALHSGVIEKMQVYCGQPVVSEGMTVEKGQLLITGIFRSANENIPTYYHHACGNIVLRTFEKKTVILPKKTYKKTPTGNEKSVFSVNFKKNNIKFSLNSGIYYDNYDKIEKKYKLWFLPLSVSVIRYKELTVSPVDTNIEEELHTRMENFRKELEKKHMEICSISETTEEREDNIAVTFTAECLVRTDKEVPIKIIPEDE